MPERLFIGGHLDGEWRSSNDMPIVGEYRLCHCSCPDYAGQPPLTVYVYVHAPMRFYDAMVHLLVHYTPHSVEHTVCE